MIILFSFSMFRTLGLLQLYAVNSVAFSDIVVEPCVTGKAPTAITTNSLQYFSTG